MILRYLLCCDEVLADIPTIVASVEDPHTIIPRSSNGVRRYKQSRALAGTEDKATNVERNDTNASTTACKVLSGGKKGQYLAASSAECETDDEYENNKEDNKFASCCRFRLHPQILLACRQLHNEGNLLLYDDKTVGVSFLAYFGETNEGLPQYFHHSYYVGANSIDSALTKWPALRRFKNWVYTVYVGPGGGAARPDDYAEWAGRNADIETPPGLPIHRLTFSCASASGHLVQGSPEFLEYSLMPFHVLACRSPVLPKELPQKTAARLHKYVFHKPRKTIQQMLETIRSSITNLSNELGIFYLFDNIVSMLLSTLPSTMNILERATQFGALDSFYKIVSLVVNISFEFLEILGNQRRIFDKEHGPRIAGVVGEAIEEFRREIEQLQGCCPQDT